jgi:hypothetical protein
MFGTSNTLNYQVSQQRTQDFLAEAERQRTVSLALNGQAQSRRARFAGARASVASVLLRAGSWLMPEEAPNGCSNPANCAFELRPGQ